MGEQVSVEVERIGVRDHGVGGQVLAVGEAHTGDPIARMGDAVHVAPGADLDAEVCGDPCERVGEASEPAPHVPGAEVLLEMRDAPERGGSVVGRRARVGGVPVGPLHESGVVEGRRRSGVERTQRVDVGQITGRAHAPQQPERRGHGAGEERALGHLPHRSRSVEEVVELRAGARRQCLDGSGRAHDVGAVIEARPVGESVATDRVESNEIDQVVEVVSGDAGEAAEHVGEGEQRRPGLPGEPGGRPLVEFAADVVEALDDGDVVARSSDVNRGSESADAGADDDHLRHERPRADRPVTDGATRSLSPRPCRDRRPVRRAAHRRTRGTRSCS